MRLVADEGGEDLGLEFVEARGARFRVEQGLLERVVLVERGTTSLVETGQPLAEVEVVEGVASALDERGACPCRPSSWPGGRRGDDLSIRRVARRR